MNDYLEQANLELAIAQNALTDAAEFVKNQAPVPRGVGIDRASDDPHVILRFGQLRARLHAAEGLLERAGRLTRTSSAPVGTAKAAALIAAIEACAFTSDLVAEISGQLVAWGGPLRTGQQRRDANGQLIQTANHWNYHYAGDYYLRGDDNQAPSVGTPSTWDHQP